MRQDINDILSAQVWDIFNKTYDGVRVLDMNLRQLEQICRAYGFTKFLTESKGQAKLAKTEKELGIVTVGVSLAPYSLGNLKSSVSMHTIDLCINATPSCKQSCVVQYGGNPAYLSGKQNAMLKRKELLVDDPCLFFAMYFRYLELKSAYCIKHGLLLSNRGNISSDIRYENVQCSMDNFQTSFSNLVFHHCARTSMHLDDKDTLVRVMPYDYTKHYDRRQDWHYHKVYSVTDHDASKAETAIDNGLPLAVVFDTARGKPLPDVYTVGRFTLPVVDGDEHDYLPAHGRKPHIVGLRFKHQAKHKKHEREALLAKHILSGFVKIAG
jgi:hypothetical protein